MSFFSSLTRKQKYLAAIVAVMALYTVIGFLVVPMVIKRILPSKLSGQLNRTVTVEAVRFNPYALSLALRNLSIKDGQENFVSFEKLYVNVEMASVFKRGLIIGEILLEKPDITIIRTEGATFNFSDLAAGGDEEKKEEAQPSGPFRFAVSNISIVSGSLVFKDLPMNATHTIADINWKVPFISSFIKYRDDYSKPALACIVNGANVSLDVKTKPFKDTLETVLSLNISGISLSRYNAYLPEDMVKFLVDKGELALSTEVSFSQDQQKQHISVQGDLILTDLGIKDNKGNEVLGLEKLGVRLLPSDIMGNHIHVGSVSIDSPVVHAVREEDGLIDLTRLVATGNAEPDQAGEQTKNAPDNTPESTNENPKPETPFVLDLDEYSLKDGTVTFTDKTVGEKGQPVVTALKINQALVKGFSTKKGSKASFDFEATVNDTASISLTGDMGIDPVIATSDIKVSGVNTAWIEPYLPENINLVILGGSCDVYGHMDMSLSGDGALKLKVTGDAGIKNFSTADPEKAENFVKWGDFTIKGIDVAMEPLAISVDEIAFSDLKNQVVIFEDSETNVSKIFGSPGEEAPPAQKPAEEASPMPSIRVGEIKLVNTELGFVDRSLSPHYTTRLSLTDLSVKGLTSGDFKAATVTAHGAVDGYAPVMIKGSLNPLGEDLFVDLDVSFSNVDMVPLTSYTGKYIGRAIGKGKLNLDVNYHIKDKAINAGNHLVLDQFTLGKSVKSPDAVSLPVGLAISLLKDRKGVIDIDLPISGRTDDPDFRWGKLVIKALVNLITKAATSPFSLVSSLVGGGEELRYIEFESGSSMLTEASTEKLDSLRKLLVERPGLKLEIVGYVDRNDDRNAIAYQGLERMVKAKEIMAAAKKGQAITPETVDAIEQSAEDREKSLRKLYKKNILANVPEGATVKQLDDPELTIGDMENALKATVTVTDEDLGVLAMERANSVKSAILADTGIDAGRIYLKEANSLAPNDPAGFKTSRVELGLQ